MDMAKNSVTDTTNTALDAETTALINRCQLVENKVNNLSARYINLVDGKLKSEINRLVNLAREYEHGTFIVLVVGPAKSGKSTLVNLLAGDYVSPTSFLECTVRPSVISRRSEGEESSLTVYSGTNNDARIEQVDSIIDIIRGFGSDEDLEGVISEKLPLNEENIRQRVQLGLENSLDSQNLLTSIRTRGGNLLQDRVFIIDMPGFDGAYQNIDNPIYDTIAQRADLIIFVQSSNAAFSKVSKEFLDILAKNNQNVPVCLVHNIFDAAWWRDEESKKAVIEGQREFARREILRHGFDIEREYSFCINLGAVEDYRKGMTDAGGKLAHAGEEFVEMEQDMYNRIIARRDSMRLNNALSRVAQRRDSIVTHAQAEIDNLSVLLGNYQTQKTLLEDLRHSIEIAAPEIPEPDRQAIAHSVTVVCNSNAAGININIHKKNSEAKDIVNTVIQSVNDSLNSSLARIFHLDEISLAIYNAYRQRLTEIESAVTGIPGAFRATALPLKQINAGQSFDVSEQIYIDNIVPNLHFWRRHSGTDIIEYISVVRELLAPTEVPGQIANLGALAHTDIPRITYSVVNEIQNLVQTYNSDLKSYFDRVSSAILANILADPDATRTHLDTLNRLNIDLRNLNI